MAAVMRLTSHLDDDFGRRSLDKSGRIMRSIESLALGSTGYFERSEPCTSHHLFTQERDQEKEEEIKMLLLHLLFCLEQRKDKKKDEGEATERGPWAWVKSVSLYNRDVIRHLKNNLNNIGFPHHHFMNYESIPLILLLKYFVFFLRFLGEKRRSRVFFFSLIIHLIPQTWLWRTLGDSKTHLLLQR